MACVVRSRPAELSSCRKAFNENLRTWCRREDVQDVRRRGREAQ